MTADTPTRPHAPAAGLFGGLRAAPQPAATPRGEPSATQRKSFADLFRADGEELHAA
jgi:hypothetical protein